VIASITTVRLGWTLLSRVNLEGELPFGVPQGNGLSFNVLSTTGCLPVLYGDSCIAFLGMHLSQTYARRFGRDVCYLERGLRE
jgi:hypothetical protein